MGLRTLGGLFEEAVGDFAGAAAADRRDAGDRQQVLDQRLGAGVVGALQRRQHARLRQRALAAAVGEDRLQRPPAREAAADAAQPDVGQAKRGKGAVEQLGVADLDLQRPGAGELGRFQRQRQDLGVGRLDVGAAVALEAGLEHFAALAGAGAEDRAEIGVLGRLSGLGRGEIGQAHRRRIVRPQAQLGP